jgi:DNA repair protein RadC
MRGPKRPPEVQLHYIRPHISSMPQIRETGDVIAILRSFIDPHRIDQKEFFWVMLLTHSHQVLGVSEIAVGDAREVSVNKKEIFQLALLANASSVILCHNHPSGSTIPSESDISITSDIAMFGSLLDIKVLDHIIITSEGHYSFADHNII